VLYRDSPPEFVTAGELGWLMKLVEVQRSAEGTLYLVVGLRPWVR